MNHRGKTHVRLLKTHRQTTELLEVTEEILYQMTPPLLSRGQALYISRS